MAGGAGIRNLVFFSHLGSNETESVCVNECIRGSFGLDLGHVTSNTLASPGIFPMVSMRFQAGSARPVRRKRAVAREAQLIRRHNKLRVVTRSVHIMTTEASNPAPVHDALHEIVALHSVLVGGAISEIIEIRRTQAVVLERPVILQALAYFITNRPIVIFALYGHRGRTSLRVALDTGITGIHVIGVRRVEDVAS